MIIIIISIIIMLLSESIQSEAETRPSKSALESRMRP